jgi:3-hydroxyisobutyrate dehydrogenase
MAEGKVTGYVGLGLMGSRMVENLLAGGIETVVFDIDPGKVAAMVAKGAAAAASPAEVARRADVILLSLPDSPQVREVAMAEDGIESGAREGLVVADLSTVSPLTPRELSEHFAPQGVAWLDAPVSGGPFGAAEGTLTIMVGGEEAALETARPALEAISARIIHMGESGMGSTTKIANQLAVSVEMIALSEAFTTGVAAGLDARRLWEVLRTSTSRCWAMDTLMPNVVLENSFDEATFALKLQRKDTRIALETARSLGVSLPATTLAEQMYSIADARGWGDKDQTAVMNLYAETVGIEKW